MNKQDKIIETLHIKINDIIKDRKKIQEAAKLLRAGHLVAFPTETVYGLGASALNPAAVRSIYTAKGRPSDNPLIVHIDVFEKIDSIAIGIPEVAVTLAKHFWPGPLTLVLKAASTVPSIVTGGLNTVAVRIPDHPVALELIKMAEVPVAAPSANISGGPSPTLAHHVIKDLGGRIAAVLDSGPCRIGLESTVLDLTSKIPRILRPGGITLEDLKEVLPEVILPTKKAFSEEDKPLAPGMKYRHYAPQAPLFLLEGSENRVRDELKKLILDYSKKDYKVGILTASPLNIEDSQAFVVFDLRGAKNPGEAAAKLFESLRNMDEAGVDIIIAEGISEKGIGFAVMNRLRKAAGKNIINL